jgi:lysophospholipase L1-like esterase
MIPRVRPVLAAAASAVLLVSGVAASTAQGSTPAPPTHRDAAKGIAGPRYVALGDSYSAAPFVASQRLDPQSCVRSTNNYPAFLAGYLNVSSYRDVTCSGAKYHDLTKRQTVLGGTKVPAQVKALSVDTDLVTIGLGGNDFSLFGELTSVCPKVARHHPHGAPCKKHFTNKSGVNTKYRDAMRVQARVAAGLKVIHAAAPNADVVVVGYPRLLPQHGSCTLAPFATGDYAFANHVERLLNRSLENAAAHHHATYVGLGFVSKGHDMCSGAHAWINGPALTTAAPFHPFEKGERGMARRAFRVITGETAPFAVDAAPPPGSVLCNNGGTPPTCSTTKRR